MPHILHGRPALPKRVPHRKIILGVSWSNVPLLEKLLHLLKSNASIKSRQKPYKNKSNALFQTSWGALGSRGDLKFGKPPCSRPRCRHVCRKGLAQSLEKDWLCLCRFSSRALHPALTRHLPTREKTIHWRPDRTKNIAYVGIVLPMRRRYTTPLRKREHVDSMRFELQPLEIFRNTKRFHHLDLPRGPDMGWPGMDQNQGYSL